MDGSGSDASTPSDKSARHEVERVAEDYIRGWYLGDAARLGRALHPDLVKRTPSDGGAWLRGVTRQRMMALTEQGGGNHPDAPTTIVVDDVEGDIATARVGSPDYLDYLHMAKTPNGWRIVNILFSPSSRASSPSPREPDASDGKSRSSQRLEHDAPCAANPRSLPNPLPDTE